MYWKYICAAALFSRSNLFWVHWWKIIQNTLRAHIRRHTVDCEIWNTLKTTLLNIYYMRFLSFGRGGHRVYSDYSATQTRNCSIVREGVVCLCRFHWFLSLSLTHSPSHYTHIPNDFEHTHRTDDTWCHVQLRIFITRNSRKLEQLQKRKQPNAKSPCNRLFGLCASESEWLNARAPQTIAHNLHKYKLMSKRKIWSLFGRHTPGIFFVYLFSFFLLLRLFERGRWFAFCYSLLPLCFADHSLIWVFLFFCIDFVLCTLFLRVDESVVFGS